MSDKSFEVGWILIELLWQWLILGKKSVNRNIYWSCVSMFPKNTDFSLTKDLYSYAFCSCIELSLMKLFGLEHVYYFQVNNITWCCSVDCLQHNGTDFKQTRNPKDKICWKEEEGKGSDLSALHNIKNKKINILMRMCVPLSQEAAFKF